MSIDFSQVTKKTATLLDKALSGRELSVAEGTHLLATEGHDLNAVQQVAHHFRLSAHGRKTSFVVTRNINFTNVCHMGCRFCNFAKPKDSAEAELLSMDSIAERAREAWQRGASEVCIQGGLHPNIKPDHYRNIILAIKKAVPELHIHAFSPFEILYGSRMNKLSYSDFLQDLKDCGLGSIPGTAAEILDTEVRKILTKDKLSARAWIDIIKAAHRVGLRSTATMMYGHIDKPRHWADHIIQLREIQKDTGGFTEFVPLGFVHQDSPLYVNAKQFTDRPVRPGPTRRENIAVHAVARILLHGHIDNIQASWVKLGPAFAQQALSFGVNDLGGTLMNESISRASGAPYGQEITPREMKNMIHQAGFQPVQRTTLYQAIDARSGIDRVRPLVPRTSWQAQHIATLEVAG
ncbi:5-amino-6-(D-ribitylamino)uracil--L-tyrosine 4-hydroxyphenyl transferase CofH [Porticoccaceae bacterium]|nr:5-amino-6-(D-ribitylamino)uracil--L-tyrosine 4-hydroxyphenyl transferase CofH [Porticoccaceae bacterium]